MGASSTSLYKLNINENPIDLDLNLWNEEYQFKSISNTMSKEK